MQDFNAQALCAAVQANDLAKAEKLLQAGATPDSHMLAIALDDDFAIPQHKHVVGSGDMLMARLLLHYGADINGNDHEPIIAAFTKPNLLGMFVVMEQADGDLKGALHSVSTLAKYSGAEYRGAEQFLRHFIRADAELEQETGGKLPIRKRKSGTSGPQ